jgi:hypothetical protein
MKQALKPHQLQLLQEVVHNRCPDLLNHVEATNVNELSREERRIIVSALGNEFASSGVGEDSKINQKGFQLEELIDFINRPNLM